MSLAPSSGTGQPHQVTEQPGLFTRQATGLVRDVTGRQAIALNFASGLPPIGIAYGVFFALTGFPGGSIPLGILLTLPLTIAFSYAFGLLSAVIPRSGGDYMLVSRILTPIAGTVSSACMMLATILAGASIGVAFVQQGVGPSLSAIGYLANSHGLVDAGTTVSTSKVWTFLLGGVLLFGVCGAFVAWGSRMMKKAIFSLIGISMLGIAVVCVIDLFTSRSGFASHFNSFARPFTHQANSYAATIAGAKKAGIPVSAGFSWHETWPLIGVMSSFGIYSYTTAFMAGEIRQGGSMKTGHRMAGGGVGCLLVLLVIVEIFFKAWGHSFLAAGYSNGLPAGLSATPTYVFLSGVQVGSPVYTALLALTFLAAFASVIMGLYLWGSRILFAWSFDGLLPESVTWVNRRNAPVTATVVTGVLMLAVTAWGVFVAKSLIQIVIYTTLIQLIAMSLLVGISAIALPYRRAALWRGSSSALRIAGVPIVVIVGALAILAGVFLYYLYFHFSYFGLTDKAQFFVWAAATIVVGGGIFLGARLIRSRQGVDLDLIYAEIPPE
jgi:basic amino acid/polyamine antiporter, APA family